MTTWAPVDPSHGVCCAEGLLDSVARSKQRAQSLNQVFTAGPLSHMQVCVPQMYTEWTTARVLVMEWVEGERLRTASQQAPADAYRCVGLMLCLWVGVGVTAGRRSPH